jgi:hypothetical protein
MTMWNLHALLRRLGIGDNVRDIDGLSSERQAIETDFAATVFSGDPQQWIPFMHPVVDELLIKIPGKVEADE